MICRARKSVLCKSYFHLKGLLEGWNVWHNSSSEISQNKILGVVVCYKQNQVIFKYNFKKTEEDSLLSIFMYKLYIVA